MTAPDANYHYEKAKQLLEDAESKGGNVATKLQLAQAHMDIYRTLAPQSSLSSPA